MDCPLCPINNYLSAKNLHGLNIHTSRVHHGKFDENKELYCGDCEFSTEGYGDDYFDYFQHRIVDHGDHIRDVLYPNREAKYLYYKNEHGEYYVNTTEKSRRSPRKEPEPNCIYCGITFQFDTEKVVHNNCPKILEYLGDSSQTKLKVIRHIERYNLVPRYLGPGDIEILGEMDDFETFSEYKQLLVDLVDKYNALDEELQEKEPEKFETTIDTYINIMTEHLE